MWCRIHQRRVPLFQEFVLALQLSKALLPVWLFLVVGFFPGFFASSKTFWRVTPEEVPPALTLCCSYLLLPISGCTSAAGHPHRQPHLDLAMQVSWLKLLRRVSVPGYILERSDPIMKVLLLLACELVDPSIWMNYGKTVSLVVRDDVALSDVHAGSHAADLVLPSGLRSCKSSSTSQFAPHFFAQFIDEPSRKWVEAMPMVDM